MDSILVACVIFINLVSITTYNRHDNLLNSPFCVTVQSIMINEARKIIELLVSHLNTIANLTEKSLYNIIA